MSILKVRFSPYRLPRRRYSSQSGVGKVRERLVWAPLATFVFHSSFSSSFYPCCSNGDTSQLGVVSCFYGLPTWLARPLCSDGCASGCPYPFSPAWSCFCLVAREIGNVFYCLWVDYSSLCSGCRFSLGRFHLPPFPSCLRTVFMIPLSRALHWSYMCCLPAVEEKTSSFL